MEYNFELIDNTKENRFEFQVDGHVAFIEYLIGKQNIFLTHTEVPKELAGKGIGSALAETVFEMIEKRDLKLIPMCAFVKRYISKHPEWVKILRT